MKTVAAERTAAAGRVFLYGVLHELLGFFTFVTQCVFREPCAPTACQWVPGTQWIELIAVIYDDASYTAGRSKADPSLDCRRYRERIIDAPPCMK